MKDIDFFATQRHYVEHLLPIWRSLPEHRRGFFYMPGSLTPWFDHLSAEGARWTSRVGMNTRPLLVAGWQDHHAAPGRPNTALLEHGAGQTYRLPSGHQNPGYPGGERREEIGLFLCTNYDVLARNYERYPEALYAVIGSPRLDERMARHKDVIGGYAAAITSHWLCSVCPESMGMWAWIQPFLRDISRNSVVPLVGHAHPRLWNAGIKSAYRDAGIEPIESFDDVIARAEVLVVDNSSAMYEWAALDRPIVVVNAPWFRRDMEHGLRFWEWSDVGEQVDDPAELPGAIERAITEDPCAKRRLECVEPIWGPTGDGQCAARAAEALMGWADTL